MFELKALVLARIQFGFTISFHIIFPAITIGLALAVPDHSTLSRRAETLEMPRPKAGSEPVHLLVDSTGLRLYGPGEWLVEKHGTRKRRGWRKLHIATDADTGRIVASALTDKDADDGAQVGPLLERAVGSEPEAPLAYALVADRDAPLGQDQLHIPQAEAEQVVEPDGVADDLSWEAVARVGGEVCGHFASLADPSHSG
jgi:Transposase DDE domain/Cytochrome bd terminal oxidase subunit I